MQKLTQKIKLVKPSLEMKEKAATFRASFLEQGEETIPGSCWLEKYEAFEDWLHFIQSLSKGEQKDLIPGDTFFALCLENREIIGVVVVRHYLTEEFYLYGHISYSVAPCHRRKGYGTEILRLALIKAQDLGVMEPVLTCDKTNHASQRVILNNKLTLQKEVEDEDGGICLVYVKSAQ